MVVDDDVVPGQRRAAHGLAPFGQVGFRGVQAQAALDQVARDQVRVGGAHAAHGQVRFAPRQAGQRGRHVEHDADVRVGRVQPLHGADDEMAGHGVRGGHAHQAGQTVVDALHLALQLVGRPFHRFGGRERQFAGRRGHVARRRAQEQGGAQRAFQRGQAAPAGGLVDAQQGGRAAQGAGPADGEKDARVIPVHGVVRFLMLLMHFCIRVPILCLFTASCNARIMAAPLSLQGISCLPPHRAAPTA